MESLGKKIHQILKPIFSGNKKEFIMINNLIINWGDIVGMKYANFSYPKLVKFDKNNNRFVLTIAVFNSSIGFFLESNSDLIIERIASFYGVKSVAKIIIKQEPKNLKHDVIEDFNISFEKEEIINKSIQGIEDKDLAKVLEKIGKICFYKSEN
jgi:hypothetical protein